MKLSEKQHLFTQFIAEWGDEFNKIFHILRYVSSYPRLAGRFARHGINNTPELIDRSQTEWLGLVSQFSHPLERDFFKPYWVPLEHDGYNLFIDLSSPGFTLFEAQYFSFEPYCWTKKIWFEDINVFLTSATDESINVTRILTENEKKWDEEIDTLFLKRIELGVAGKINPPEISDQEIFIPDGEPEIILNQKCLTITDVSPIILKLLLPENHKIRLTEFIAGEDLTDGLCDTITDIKGLYFYLHSIGSECVSSFEFLFIPSDAGFMKYENNVFKLSQNDYWLLNDLHKRFLSIKQEIKM